MKKMTFEEIVAHLKKLNVSHELFVTNYDCYYDEDNEDEDYDGDEERTFDSVVTDLGKIEDVENVTTGDGNDAYTIKHFVDHDVYIKVDYWYSSHGEYGYEQSKFEHVIPVERTVKVYQNVDGSQCFNCVEFYV